MNEDVDPRRISTPLSNAIYDEMLSLLPRLALKAPALERKIMGRRHRGAPMIGITSDDLVQHAVLRLLSGQPPFDPGRQRLFHYLLRRMEEEMKRILERVENDTARTTYASEAERENIVFLEDFQTGSGRVEAENHMIRFLEWVSVHHPDLRRLTELMALEGIISVSDQAHALNESVEKIYKRRERLRAALQQFSTMVSILGKHR